MLPSAQTRPEPMNSSPIHPKVKVSMTLAHSVYVAGKFVTGKMEVECRADKGLGISIIMVELFAVQELASRDHSATSTFLHSRRLFQGPDLPPSNAVQAHSLPEDPLYPPHYHQALRGISKFLFRIPLPSSAPSSINFGSDLARVRYELRATVGVVWKGEKTLVVCNREIDVVESCEEGHIWPMPEGVVVGEFGKIWVQGTVVGGMVIAGESACLELQVKNHSNKRNTGLTLSLTRSLVLPGSIPGETSLLQVSDNLCTVSFRGPDYIITPGAEGVASLVFDVPNHARGVRPGPYEGGDNYRLSESIFEVRCILGITINMEHGTKDIHLDIPVTIVHPDAVPEPAEFNGYPYPEPVPLPQHLQNPYPHSGFPTIPAAYIDSVQNQAWLPPSPSHTPHINDINHFSSPTDGAEPQYSLPQSPHVDIPYVQTRPLSAEPTAQFFVSYAAGSGPGLDSSLTSQSLPNPFEDIESEEGKGERATRVTQHLRMSSRYRSVSPQSHRFPLPIPPTGVKQFPPSWAEQSDPDHLQSPPSAPLLLPAESPPTESFIHASPPFLCPKRSFSKSSLTRDRVEELERMAEEVGSTTAALSPDSPQTTFEAYDFEAVPALSFLQPAEGIPVTEFDINKTPLVPPPVTKKAKNAKDKRKLNGRTRIDEFFANASPIPTELKAPKTPMAAVTPVKLPSKPKCAESKAQLHPNGQAESGLDALEKRLLAEGGTRKTELANDQRSAWNIVGAKPIDIPSKDFVRDDPMNDSAISSLTLAGERMGFDREEVELNGVLDDAGHDSDEKTHRAGKSTASTGSRKGSKDKGEKWKKKGKKDKDKDRTQDRAQDGESRGRKKKTAAAAKGRVAAWLGAIDPDVPPVEDVLPPSPAVSRNLPSSMESKDVLLPVVDNDIASLPSKPLNDVESKDLPSDAASASIPHSSGFVPIGTFKSGTPPRPFKFPTKYATEVRKAQRVAEVCSVSNSASTVAAPLDNKESQSPMRTDAPLPFASLIPAPQIAPSHKAKPPSIAEAIDMLEAKHYSTDTGKIPNANIELSNSNRIMQPSYPVALPTPQDDPEAKYNVRSARRGHRDRVTAITSSWATGTVDSSIEPTTDLAPLKPLRNCAPDCVAKGKSAKVSSTGSSFVTPNLPEQSSIKSLLAATAPIILPPNLEPVDFASKRPRSIIKSTSVPAIISSSHATPTLSSTASLAHLTSSKPQAPTRELPSPDSSRQVLGQTAAKIAMSSSKPGPTGGDLAFGQARLRDLIKKYQGHAV